MALSEQTIVDKIEVNNKHKVISVRTATLILRDGKEIARELHRHTIAPGQDVSQESPEVQAVAQSLWTEEVIQAYQNALGE